MKCPYCIKVCSKCGKLLVANEMNFSKKKRGKYGLHAECKQCRKQYREQYYRDNKDKELEKQKQYKEQHKDEIKEQQKQYKKQWNEDNPDKIFNYCAKRRQLEENQGNGITKEQWLEMMDFFDWKCAYSGIQFSSDNKKNDRTIDHIIALNNGGLNEIWNCVPMYMPYNSSKQDRNMMDWYTQQEYFSEERLQKICEWQQYALDKWCNANE